MADVWSLLVRALKCPVFLSLNKSSFCLAYIEFIAIPATSFVDNFKQLRGFQAVLVVEALQ